MGDVDNSIKTSNTNILNLLKDAGVDGLHIDDILYLLGFKTKKELIFRLRDLKSRCEIQEVEGGRWKRAERNMNGNGEHQIETFITPSLQEDLPQIHLPGDSKFSSYKNTLQEYCQKKHFSVPQYKAQRENNGLVGTVTFSLNNVRCTHISGSVKEADARAAFDALRGIGYLKDHEFVVSSNQLKRKEAMAEYDPSVAKQVKSANKDPLTFKSQLNEFAQKEKHQFPTYESVAVSGGFISTVNFNNVKFKSISVSKKRRDAEQNAAQVALNTLIGIPLPAEEPMAIGEADVVQMVSEARQAAQPVALKNRLQEYCQRLGKTLPTYDTRVNEFDKTYESTVTVQGIQYTGAAVKGKKNAETGAAEEALKALELMA